MPWLKPGDQPELPFQGPSDTSREAAVEQMLTAHNKRAEVYRAIEASRDGLTDREIQAKLGMRGSTERPRRRELELAGMIRDSGRRRDGCTVWEVVT